jgi:biotin operon repressor
MTDWGLLTIHARTLMCIAHDPDVRLRDIALQLGVTERSVHRVVNDLAEAGYVVKDKGGDGRRNRYAIQGQLPLEGTIGRRRTIGDMLEILVDARPEPVGRGAK